MGIADLVARFRAKAAEEGARPESWVFYQKRDPSKPLWDSGVRDALHQAAHAEGCDFPGLGPHSFRRANITWRQQVGGSAVEASKIAGHADLEMTSPYTFVAPERQNEVTRRIQERLAAAAGRTSQPTDAAPRRILPPRTGHPTGAVAPTPRVDKNQGFPSGVDVNRLPSSPVNRQRLQNPRAPLCPSAGRATVLPITFSPLAEATPFVSRHRRTGGPERTSTG